MSRHCIASATVCAEAGKQLPLFGNKCLCSNLEGIFDKNRDKEI
jgi:hypothetical protein